MSLQPWRIVLLPIDTLKPHEEVEEHKVLELSSALESIGEVRSAILVDSKTLVILDGHHRVEALKLLGCKLVPALLVDYDSDCVQVSSWRVGTSVAKDDVRRAGLQGSLMPPKTSRHSICIQPPQLSVSLAELRDSRRAYEVLVNLQAP